MMRSIFSNKKSQKKDAKEDIKNTQSSGTRNNSHNSIARNEHVAESNIIHQPIAGNKQDSKKKLGPESILMGSEVLLGSEGFLLQAIKQGDIVADKIQLFYLKIASMFEGYQMFEKNLKQQLGNNENDVTLLTLIEAAKDDPATWKFYEDLMIKLITGILINAGYNDLASDYDELVSAYGTLYSLYENIANEEIRITRTMFNNLADKNTMGDWTFEIKNPQQNNEYVQLRISPSKRNETLFKPIKSCHDSFEKLYLLLSSQGLNELAQKIEPSINKIRQNKLENSGPLIMANPELTAQTNSNTISSNQNQRQTSTNPFASNPQSNLCSVASNTTATSKTKNQQPGLFNPFTPKPNQPFNSFHETSDFNFASQQPISVPSQGFGRK